MMNNTEVAEKIIIIHPEGYILTPEYVHRFADVVGINPISDLSLNVFNALQDHVRRLYPEITLHKTDIILSMSEKYKVLLINPRTEAMKYFEQILKNSDD